VDLYIKSNGFNKNDQPYGVYVTNKKLDTNFEIHYDGTCPLCNNFMRSVSKSKQVKDTFAFSTKPPSNNVEKFKKGIAVVNKKTGEILWKDEALLIIGKNLDGWRGILMRQYGLLPRFMRRTIYSCISINRHFLSKFI